MRTSVRKDITKVGVATVLQAYERSVIERRLRHLLRKMLCKKEGHIQ